MNRKAIFYIKDIYEYICKILEYTEGLNFEEFSNDNKTCDAVIRCIEVIGEASKNIPNEIREKYQFIPWREMAGMRDIIIHGYFTVNFNKIWSVVIEDLPKLRPLIEQIIKDYNNM
jgi:uncharacterized protein with HEPN domain